MVVPALAIVLAAASAYALQRAASVRSRLGGRVGSATPAVASRHSPVTHHYMYVFAGGAIYVYDIDHGHRLVERRALPVGAIRGAVASPRTHMLYVSHGGDGGVDGTGGLLKYDLLRNRVIWDRYYNSGVDSIAITPDGSRLYLPDGALSVDGIWDVIDTRSGNLVGQIHAGSGPHDTVVDLSGRRVYLGGRNFNYLEVASTSTNRVIERIGPLSGGVRPFTINGNETLAYTSATGLLGFQVSSILTRHVLYTATPPSRFTWDPSSSSFTDPSHGVSLSPDERRLWIVDAPNSYLHVFDVSGLPSAPPRDIADIPLVHGLSANAVGCTSDCVREGWLLHSRSGCFVYVGDSGDVYSAVTFKRVAFLPALQDTRIFLEIDWRRGRPVATTSRFGVGYVTGGHGPPPPPACGRAG